MLIPARRSYKDSEQGIQGRLTAESHTHPEAFDIITTSFSWIIRSGPIQTRGNNHG